MQVAKFGRQTIVRESGIELLKIVAIFLIVIFHVVQTLSSENLFISYQDYVLDLSVATTDSRNFILTLFCYFGAWGNTIFFVCSAWFLLHSSRYNKKKWLFMLVEVWIVSLLLLVSTLIIRGGDISVKIIIQSIFPTIFANNWYITCYLLFYPIHPLLNLLVKKMDRQTLFRISAAMFVLYCCFDFVEGNLFFPSRIILWITIYFVMAYIQLWMQDFSNDIKKNVGLFFVGFIGYFGIAIIANILGLHVSYLHDKVLHWSKNCNPFLIAMSIAMFNFACNCKFKNRVVNYISSLSLLIYIIHENIILRTYFRPLMVNYVYLNYGYNHIILWVLIMAITVFLFGLILAICYDRTLRHLIKPVSDWLYSFGRRIYLKIEMYLLKFH